MLILFIKYFYLKERHAILTLRDVSKFDSSPYRVVAENDLGVDSAIIKIQISGKHTYILKLL